MDYRLLLDAPGEPKARIQIAAIGDFSHGRYGDFSITPTDIESWKTNLSRLPGGRALIDLDHRSDRAPRNTEAAGWITDVHLEDGVPMADVEWTSLGKQAITDKRFLFFSPSYGKHPTETGEIIDNVLTGGALTNKPFLESLPTVSLAAPERMNEAYEDLYMLDVPAKARKAAAAEGNALPDGSYPIRNAKELHSAAVLAASGHGDVKAAKALIRKRAGELGVSLSHLPGFADDQSDSRAVKKMDTELLTLLDLPADADDAKVLEAITALKATPAIEPATETKTLEQLAADEHKVLLDSGTLAQLRADATAGAAAAAELHANRFETAWTRALDAGRAVAGQEEWMRHVYTLDAEKTLKELDTGPEIVNTKPSGWRNSVVPEVGETPPGVDPANHQLDQAIWKHIAENNLPQTDYPQILDRALKGELKLL